MANVGKKTSLGRFLEETMAQSDAMDSVLIGMRYGWKYRGVNRPTVILEASLILGAGATAGYLGGRQLFGE
jgi:hypothetical protein